MELSIGYPEQTMDIEAGAARSQWGKLDFHQGLLIFSGSCHPSPVITLFVDALRKDHEVRVEFQVEITPS